MTEISWLLMMVGWILPRSFVMPILLMMRLVAKLPMVTMTLGCMILISWSRRSLQLLISSFSGLRLFSG